MTLAASELGKNEGAMAATKKRAAVEQEFSVPTLSEACADYAATLDRLEAVRAERDNAEREVAAIIADLEKKPASRPLRAGVAALVGDAIEADADDRHARLAAARAKLADTEAAEKILRERLAHQRGAASRKVCDAVRAEYGKRVSALCKALNAAVAAHGEVDGLLSDLEAEDVAWQGLGVFRAPWLKDRVESFVKEAREKSYVR